jgi:HEAT repeat protein
MADSWPAPRAESADLAAELGDPTAIDTLRKILTEHDAGARLLAAQALWRHTGEAEVATLTEILTSRRTSESCGKPSTPSPGSAPPPEPPSGRPSPAKTRWRNTAATASFSAAVRETEEVVPVNVLTWVLPSGVTVGR